MGELYSIFPADEMYNISMDFDAEDFWNGMIDTFTKFAEVHQTQCKITLCANVMIGYNVEQTLTAAGYEVKILNYDSYDDTYTIQIFWDEIAITGKGNRGEIFDDDNIYAEDIYNI